MPQTLPPAATTPSLRCSAHRGGLVPARNGCSTTAPTRAKAARACRGCQSVVSSSRSCMPREPSGSIEPFYQSECALRGWAHDGALGTHSVPTPPAQPRSIASPAHLVHSQTPGPEHARDLPQLRLNGAPLFGTRVVCQSETEGTRQRYAERIGRIPPGERSPRRKGEGFSREAHGNRPSTERPGTPRTDSGIEADN